MRKTPSTTEATMGISGKAMAKISRNPARPNCSIKVLHSLLREFVNFYAIRQRILSQPLFPKQSD